MKKEKGLTHCCKWMRRAIKKKDIPLMFIPRLRHYAIPLHKDRIVLQEIYYCPWCGIKLPGSLGDAWFRIMELMKLDPHDPKDRKRIPKPFFSERWWQNKEVGKRYKGAVSRRRLNI